ncbi:MAG TPA: hypothetical protein PKA64_00065, partial [Myxococcota bacterium]|nr:hypothetical protein [Myxococcota bacterium]
IGFDANRGDAANEIGDNMIAVDFGAGRTAIDMSIGEYHGCALLDNGEVKCWGYNAHGQLGQGHTSYIGDNANELGGWFDPIPLTGGPVVDVEVGGYHSCARYADGRVKCWGYNGYGQLGKGNTTYYGDNAGEIAPLGFIDLGTGRTAVGLSLGLYHSCAQLDNATMKCWGYWEPLGLGATGDNRGDAANEMGNNLAAVSMPAPVDFVFSGYHNSCGVTTCGATYCWGQNSYGQLGLEDTAQRYAPVSVPVNWGTFRYVPTGASVSCNENRRPSAPVLDVVRVGAPTVFDLRCTVTTPSSDIDGDTITYQAAWTKDGVPFAQTTTTTFPGDTILAADVATGVYACTVTPSDAVGAGAPTTERHTVVPFLPHRLVDVSGTHTCAIRETGQVVCFGLNSSGQLGIGSTVYIGDQLLEMGDYLTPVNLGAGRTAVEVTTGPTHSCALLDDATVRCWGSNDYGQLGQGNTTKIGDQANEVGNPAVNPVVNFGAGATVAQIGAGEYYSCARLTDGRVKCWGYGQYGRLGIGFDTYIGDAANELGDNMAAVDLGVGREAIDLTVGQYHACALLDDGNVKCWGYNGHGELGLGHTTYLGDNANEMGAYLANVPLTGGVIADVEAKFYHTCARYTDGRVKCWGYNGYGQLGQNNTVQYGDAPNEVAALGFINLGTGRTAVDISLGYYHTCAALDNGTLKCWGYYEGIGLGSSANQRGDSANEMGDNLPAVAVPAPVGHVQAGNHQTCAVTTCGVPYCWGPNTYGQLGLESGAQQYSPTSATDIGTFRYLAYDDASACNVNRRPSEPVVRIDRTSAGSAYDIVCSAEVPSTDIDGDAITYTVDWLKDGQPFVGYPITTDIEGDTIQAADLETAVYTCVLTPYDAAGAGPSASVRHLVAPPVAPRLVANGQYHFCAVLDDGGVTCMGYNGYGQLGVGSTAGLGDDYYELGDSAKRVNLGAGRTAVEVAAGDYHTCALLDGGDVRCWGNNNYGQLGIGNTTRIGDNANEVGNDAVDPVVNLGTGMTAAQIGAGESFTCARLVNGDVKCWGYNAYGRLGTGNTNTLGDGAGEMGDALLPIPLGFYRKAIDLAVGRHHACALLDTGALKCWGYNDYGQLGTGNTSYYGDGAQEMGEYLPEVNVSNVPVVDVEAGELHTCALLTDGRVKCWGYNGYGQLGYGHTSNLGGSGGQMGTSLAYVGLGTGHYATSITTGSSENCAVLDDQTVKCWGIGSAIGLGNTGNRGDAANEMGDSLPAVSVGFAVDRVYAYGNAVCAVGTCGQLKCWGYNGYGQAAQGSGSSYYYSPPTSPINLGSFRYVPTPNAQSCNVNRRPSAPVVRVSRAGSLTQYGLVCGITTPSSDIDGDAFTYTFTWTKDGAPWTGSTATTTYPGDTIPLGAVTTGLWRCSVAASDAGGPSVAGTDDHLAVPENAPRLVAMGGVGPNFQCAILEDGGVRCVGYNGHGELGRGDTVQIGDSANEIGDAIVPVNLGAGRTAIQLTAGDYHVCALLDDRSVRCWGYNAYGQLGIGNTTQIGDNANEVGNDAVNPVVNLGAGAQVAQVEAGDSFTCARLTDGRVKCWGYGQYGRTGQGNSSNLADSPTELGDAMPVVDLGVGKTALDITTGRLHACALLNDGKVKCWGYNDYGQLGLGTTSYYGDGANEMGNYLPVVQLGTGTVVDVEAAAYHSCARFLDGQVKCWGYNAYGQLGIGNTTQMGDNGGEMGTSLPYAALGTGRAATSLTVGEYSTCVSLDNGTAKCWGHSTYIGYNNGGHRGDAANEMGDNMPALALPAGVVGGYGRYTDACALTSCGATYCWGTGDYGQLGLGNASQYLVPSPKAQWGTYHWVPTPGADACNANFPPGAPTVGVARTSINPGFDLVCSVVTPAVDHEGDALTYAVSWKKDGVTWAGTTTSTNLTGDTIPSAELGTALWTCSVTATDGVGTGPAGSESHLVIPNARRVTADSGSGHTCVIADDGSVRCWGDNTYGQIGRGDTQRISDAANEMGDALVPVNLGAGRTAVELALGTNHVCALLDDGSVRCWGYNGNGNLGIGNTTSIGDQANEVGNDAVDPLVDLGPGVTARRIDAGYHHTCALLTDGRIKCWGYNGYGQLGIGNTSQIGDGAGEMGAALAAIDLGSRRFALDFAVGGDHTCALLDTGDVKCWGRNNAGQLGQGHTNNLGDGAGEGGDAIPAVSLAGTVVDIDIAGWHSCARFLDGKLKCWGYAAEGQLGLGSTTARGDNAGEMGASLPFVSLGTGRTAVDVRAGNNNTCAIMDNARVKCWGYGSASGNSNVQYGDAANEMGDSLPTLAMPGTFTGVNVLVNGQTHGCEVSTCGAMVCWGLNANAQLGTGNTTAQAVPFTTPLNIGTGRYIASDKMGGCSTSTAPVVTTCRITPGAPGVNDTLRADARGTDYEGQTITWSYAWRRNGALDAAETGVTFPAAKTSSGDVIDLTCTPSDGGLSGAPLAAASVTVGNSLPVATTCSINQARPADSAAITVTRAATDVDGDAVTWTYVWTVNGAVDAGHTGASYPAAATAPGDRVSVTCVPHDAGGAGFSKTSAAVEVNHPAVVASCVIVPVAPDGDDALAAVAGATDADADSFTLRYAWSRNGVVDPTETAATFPASKTDPGDVIGVDCSANDGIETGAGVSATDVTVLNRPPSAPGVAITPAQPVAGQALVCTIAESTDADGDGVSYTIAWTHAGAPYVGPTQSSAYNGDTIPAGQVTAGTWVCTVTPNDGADDGPDGADSALVAVGVTWSGLLGDGGGNRTCVILEDGGVRCAGDNAGGLLGLSMRDDLLTNTTVFGETLVDGASDTRAIELGANERIAQVAVGPRHACALWERGDVTCWGMNDRGQLGVGSTDTRGDRAGELGLFAQAIDFGTAAAPVQVVAGDAHTCARFDDGSVRCWGYGNAGRLGIGSTTTVGDGFNEMGSFLATTNLGTGRTAVDLAAGRLHTCALRDDGTVVCWGQNNYGQLGIGDTNNFSDQAGEFGDAFVAVPLGAAAVDVEAGWDHTCAILVTGQMKCWGRNQSGQLGLGHVATIGDQPGEVAAAAAVDLGADRRPTSMALGREHTCVTVHDGTVLCWGRNSSGEAG